ncbi:TetR/AcrR family transcriptional regulator [Sphaerimonospora thailandensis]|uniref:TetR/AcrR family transcriptional regulator n=1 Tax=Sphaerimonospora thailandensis TaxID=795644 RepID=UPI00194F5D0A|nr:TetR/AcrR family transcriptional regulator [Sphaerimonospora thailandensis]
MSPTPERREKILAISAELFAAKGIAATTVRDIGEAAGVFSGSLYHHFKSKNAIVTEILGDLMNDVHRRFARVAEHTRTPRETLQGLIRETLVTIDQHPHATAIYQNDRQYLRDNGLLEPVDSASRGVRDYWMTAIRAGIADGSLRDDIPAEIFYRSVRDSLWATMHWPIRRGYSTPEFADLLAKLFFEGFAARRD